MPADNRNFCRQCTSVESLFHMEPMGRNRCFCRRRILLPSRKNAGRRGADGFSGGRPLIGRRQKGRDTKALTDQEVRTAALETLAENLSDGVIAPLFWYLLLGLPGMMTYKMINTLDSMIGYKNKRYKDFGCFAAHTDDAANYLPARLTALLMAIVAGRRSLLPFIKKYGRRHASPNSGFPEAALAGILDCRFGGPHDYFGETVYKPYIGTNNRPLNGGDMQRAIAVNRRSETAMLLLITAVYLLIFLFYLSIRGSGIDSGLFQ